mmetsp:Transcript_22019/g.47902  ORF Transcript_22019/g.47902 Transcript_22019/m.47902 type:complete len:330 (+) Transcript_22019:1024-2013(+)
MQTALQALLAGARHVDRRRQEESSAASRRHRAGPLPQPQDLSADGGRHDRVQRRGRWIHLCLLRPYQRQVTWTRYSPAHRDQVRREHAPRAQRQRPRQLKSLRHPAVRGQLLGRDGSHGRRSHRPRSTTPCSPALPRGRTLRVGAALPPPHLRATSTQLDCRNSWTRACRRRRQYQPILASPQPRKHATRCDHRRGDQRGRSCATGSQRVLPTHLHGRPDARDGWAASHCRPPRPGSNVPDYWLHGQRGDGGGRGMRQLWYEWNTAQARVSAGAGTPAACVAAAHAATGTASARGGLSKEHTATHLNDQFQQATPLPFCRPQTQPQGET